MTLHDDCSPRTIAIREPFVIHIAAQRCQLWTCPHCAKVNKRRLIELAVAGEPNYFLTLTAPPRDDETPNPMARRIRKAWSLLTRQWARHKGINALQNLTMFDRHKSGFPHLHILLRCEWTDVVWVRNRWQKLTGGTQIKLEPITDRRKAAAYCAKYMAKDPHKFGSCKRYTRSQGWVLPTAPAPWVSRFKGMPAEIIERPFQCVAAEVEQSTWHVCERRHSYLMAGSHTQAVWCSNPRWQARPG